MGTATRDVGRLLAGVRSGKAPLALLGAAVAAIGFLRRLDGPRDQLISTTKLRRGQRLEIAVVEPDRQRTR